MDFSLASVGKIVITIVKTGIVLYNIFSTFFNPENAFFQLKGMGFSG